MNERPENDGNQHGKFNLLDEYLRGAMYRGGAERDTVITGYVLAAVSTIVFVAVMLGLSTLLQVVGVNFGDVIATMARDLPLLLLGLVLIAFLGCVAIVVTLAQWKGK